MRRRPSSFTFALCASLIAHASLLATIAWWFVDHTPPPKLAALVRPELDQAPIITPAPLPPPSTPPPAQKPTPPPPAPPPPPKEDFDQATKMPLHDDSGETDTHGTANRSTPGDKPMEARAGLEQANLTRNDHPDEASRLSTADVAAQTGTKTPTDAAPAPPPAFGVAQPTPQPHDTDPGRQKMISVADADAPAPAPVGTTPEADATLGSPTGKHDAPPNQQPAAQPIEIQGHASISSDTDSEAFAHANSAEFHDGQLTARQGRRVRTTRIEFGLAASADALAVADPTVVLGVRVDAAGDVQNVVLLHSSGSPNIDLPCQRSVYNWWFEPKKDKDGRPQADLWVVRID